MKKVSLLLLFVFWCSAQDLNSLIARVVDLNKQLQNQASTQILVEIVQKKEEVMRQIVQAINQKNVLPFANLQKAITGLDNVISTTREIQTPYLFALNTLKLNTLIAQKTLLQTASNLAKKSFFTTHSQIREEISQAQKTLQKLEVLPHESFKENELKNFRLKKADFDLLLRSYLEILNFLDSNMQLVLPENFWTNFTFSWFLEQITQLLPKNIQSIALTKTLISLCFFIVLLLFRHTIAHILLRLISMLSHFLENEDVQEQIKKQIATPILWMIILSSINIALIILAFPHPVSSRFKIWLNACLIIDFSWLAILLFKGYGIAILGNIAQKNNTFRREVVNLLLKVIYFLIVVVTILILLKNFGFNVSALIASLGIGGVAVAFAIKDMLANFFASVILLFDNSFNQGDWIVCGDIEGTVIEIGLRRTTIRTFDNAMLFVPNSLLANGSVRNWNRRKVGRRIRLEIGVTYSASPDQIRACVRDIQLMLLNHPQIAKVDENHLSTHYQSNRNIVSLDDLLGYKSNLFVVLDQFAGSSINILVYCFSKTVNWGEWLNVRQDVMLKIMEILDQNGLSFAFPSQSLYIEKIPNKIAEMTLETK